MRKSNYKGRCEKRNLSKCRGVCKTYDLIQSVYADMLQADTDIIEFSCNVLLEGSEYNVAITQRYLGVSSQRAEQALKNHIVIPT